MADFFYLVQSLSHIHDSIFKSIKSILVQIQPIFTGRLGMHSRLIGVRLQETNLRDMQLASARRQVFGASGWSSPFQRTLTKIGLKG